MPRSYVTDLRHFLDEDGQPAPGPAGALRRYLGRIAESGSVMQIGEGGKIGLCCANPSQRKRCGGQLFVGRTAADSLEWQCTRCAENGLLSGWAKTQFDLGDLRAKGQDEHCDATLQFEELNALRRLAQVPRPLLALLAGTIDIDEGYLVVPTSHDELVALRDIALAAADTARREDRRLLDRFAARVDAFRTTMPEFLEPDDPDEDGPERLMN